MQDHPTGGQPVSYRLTCQIEGERRAKVTVVLAARALVGRVDDETDSPLGLDLAPYGGATLGVSRIHAALEYREGGVFVEDLASTNGTRINGFQLTPNHLYRLRDGDELEFGSLRVIVRFTR